MSLESISFCPICSSSSFSPYQTVIDYTVSKEQFAIVQCQQCGLAITNPRPNPISIGEYYKSEMYISHSARKTSLFDWIYRLVRTFTLSRKLNLIEQKIEKGSLLDFGCGTGDFLNHVKTRNWQVAGTEPSELARTKAKNLNLTVEAHLEKISGLFDVITLWHVLEHVHDLQKTLLDLTAKLNSGGYMFIAVPNPLSFDALHYKAQWAAYDVPRHLWHFNKKNMEQLLTNSALKLEQIIPMKLDAYYVAMLSEKYQHPTRNGLLNFCNGAILGFKSNLKALHTGNYSSLIYIAQAR